MHYAVVGLLGSIESTLRDDLARVRQLAGRHHHGPPSGFFAVLERRAASGHCPPGSFPIGPDSISVARSLLPDATLISLSVTTDMKKILDSGAPEVDAILHSSEHGAAWTLLYREFSVVVPRPVAFLPFGYAVARGNDELAASWIHRLIGDSGASVVSRVMGLILASVAAANVLAGIREYFSL